MIQIYLLCLVREGKIRISLGPKSGLPLTQLDYSNLGDVDFSAAVLAAMSDVQKMARPENWEVLRLYAEKLLGEMLPTTHDDSVIAGYRARLKVLVTGEREASARLSLQAKDLFGHLGVENPYAQELQQFERLFATDLSSGDDISLMLHGLKEAFGYEAFESNRAQPQEVDDLANRLRNYRDMQKFLAYEREIRIAYAYTQHTLPDIEALKAIRKAQAKLAAKLSDLRPCIDADVKLKTELIGARLPGESESGTLAHLIEHYATAYIALHDSTLSAIERQRARIADLLDGDTMVALRKLEGITALQPPVSQTLEDQLTDTEAQLFTCLSPSRNSLEEALRSGPVHECALTFTDASERLTEARSLVDSALDLFRDALHRKLEVFLNPAVRQRLEQGKDNPVIGALLGCSKVEDVQELLVRAVLEDEAIVGLINRYLKRIVVKRLRMADFKPRQGTIERDQIVTVAEEFRRFLETELRSIEGDGDMLPVLQLE